MSATAWTVAHGSAGVAGGSNTTMLRSTCGQLIPLPSDRWWAEAMQEDIRVLDLAIDPVIDLGCGPGRHTAALARRGLRALGVDSSGAAVAAARARGATVVQRSVFDRLPAEGTWGTGLLLDGNVGIGGDPARLLRRVHALLRPGGRAFVEVEAPGVSTECLRVRAEVPRGATDWFPWALVGVDDIASIGASAGLALAQRWVDEERWFVRLDKP